MSDEPTAKRKAGRPKGARTIFDPERHCGAKTSTKSNDGTPCTRVKGFGTSHPGEGRCKFHGGSNPMKHGRYSQLRRSRNMARFHELREQYEAEPDPLNLVPDLIALRARSAVLFEEEDKDREMLADWHESYTGKFRQEMNALRTALRSKNAAQLMQAMNTLNAIMDAMPPKPVKLWDPYSFTKAVTAMAALVEKISNQRERQQVPMKAIVDLQDKMAIVMMTSLRKELADLPGKADDIAGKIANAWLSINIEF